MITKSECEKSTASIDDADAFLEKAEEKMDVTPGEEPEDVEDLVSIKNFRQMFVIVVQVLVVIEERFASVLDFVRYSL